MRVARAAAPLLVVLSAACAREPGRPERDGGPPAAQGPSALPRIRAALDAVRAIDTHDHLFPFAMLAHRIETDRGPGMNLYGLWERSYFHWYNPLTPWKPKEPFADWWARAKGDFDNARASGFYRYQLPAFQDLYGVDFDRITDAQAAALDARIFENYRDDAWARHVITERANIELVFVDPYWARLDFKTSWPFEVLVFNVTSLVRGFHPSEYERTGSEFHGPSDDPYYFAKKQGLPVATLDDYLAVLDRLFEAAKAREAACLKTTLAYHRTLQFDNVPKERAARAYGKPRSELTEAEIKDFEDYIMWQLAERGARYDLPLQIHTGDARLQGSSPMLLLDLIRGNPKTKFILFHGGFPWVGETGAIVMRNASHVWIDSTWLPTISFSTAKRALHEWLEVMPSNHIMWGADVYQPEGVYGATVVTRRCVAEVLAEKVERGDLREEDAIRIGRQILRENALELFPQLRGRLRKGAAPPAAEPPR